MTADELKNYVFLILKKVNRGNLGPDRFNMLWAMAEDEFLTNSLPDSKRDQNVFEESKKISAWLAPLKSRQIFTVSGSGEIQFPDDYVYPTYLNYLTGKDTEKPVRIVKDNELGYRSSSKIFSTRVWANFRNDHIKIAPQGTRVVLGYLRRPVKPLWAYTLSNGRPVYDAANSVDSEFPREAQYEIIHRLLSLAGVNLSKEDVVAYSEMKLEKGI